MKALHRPDLFCWSQFQEHLNIDFSSFAWIRPEGNVLIDPLPLSPHNQKRLEDKGGAAWILLTNADHMRGSAEIAKHFGCKIAAPAAEVERFPFPVDLAIEDETEPFPGLWALSLQGSKTPAELALILDRETLICGDLLRAHRAQTLRLLPEEKIRDRKAALASLKRLLDYEGIQTILMGDGWHIFGQGHTLLEDFLEAQKPA